MIIRDCKQYYDGNIKYYRNSSIVYDKNVFWNDKYLWLHLRRLGRPYLLSVEPFDTGSDSRLAMSKLMEVLSSSKYSDSISFTTNLGISLRFCIEK